MRMPVLYLLIALLLGASCKEAKRYHNETPPEFRSDYAAAIYEHRKALDEMFRDPERSPLPDRYRKDFEGLSYFATDSTYRVQASLQRTPEAPAFLMPTTTARKSKEKVYGIARFRLGGKEYTLELYEDASGEDRSTLFLPFTDATNGDATYAGGRYIDLEYPEEDSLVIDFNKAYNPYCVYNKKFSCPLVPQVNDLPIPIPAGVKDFQPEN